MVWLNRNFFLLWTGQLVSQLGDKFYSVALAWWVLEKTDSPVSMGLFMVASMLPELLFGLVAGGYIDRWNRKVIIIASDVIRGAAVMSVALLSALGSLEIWHIFTAAVIISLASAFFNPAVMAVLPRIVKQEDLPRANSLSQMITGLSTVVGPVLGVALAGLLGYQAVFMINGVSYLVSALLEGFITLPAAAAQVRGDKLLVIIKEGFGFIAENKTVRIILLVIGIVHIFYGSLAVAMPFLAKTLAGSGIQSLGYLETSMGAGMILGAAIIGRQKVKNLHERQLFIIILAAGFCSVLLGLTRYIGIAARPPYIVILIFIGMAAAFASVYWRSLLQIHVPDEMAGRVFSASTIIADVSLPVSFGMFGVLLQHTPLPLTLVGCGLSLMLISVTLILRYRRFL